jgi:hypothetical protein
MSRSIASVEKKALVGSQERANPPARGLDVFVIDSGRASAAQKVLAENLRYLEEYMLEEHDLYVLSEQQSVDVLKESPLLIGSDPMVLIIDRAAYCEKRKTGFAVRVNFGLLQGSPSAVLALMTQIVRLTSYYDKNSFDLSEVVRTVVRKGGARGTTKLIMEEIGEVGGLVK